MKIILSRKGIDGGNGGTPSPLIKNSKNEWVPVSIPIGGGSEKRRYNEVSVHGYKLDELAKSLGVKDKGWEYVSNKSHVHLDPDLDEKSVNRKNGWKPMFGQHKAALGHLRNNSIDIGDLFLFAGWFRHAENNVKGASYINGNNIHAFFGWLQVEHIWNVAGEPTAKLQEHHPQWAWEHPHFQDEDACGYGNIYVAAKNLTIGDKTYDLPGGGVFHRFTEKAQLTWPEERNRSVWKLPDFFHKQNQSRLTCHDKETRWQRCEKWWRLESVPRGQEFIFDTNKLDATERKAAFCWAVDLIQEHA